MKRRLDTNHVVALLLVDLSITLAALFLASLARYRIPWGVQLELQHVRVPLPIYALVALMWPVTLSMAGAYDNKRTSLLRQEFSCLVLGTGFALLALAGALYLSYRDVPRRLFFYFGVFDGTALLIWRYLFRLYLDATTRLHAPRVLVVGAGRLGREVAGRLGARDHHCTVVGFADDDPEKQGQRFAGVPVLGTVADVPSIVQRYRCDEVIFALPLRAHRHVEDLVLALQRYPVSVRVVPDLLDLAFFRATVDDLDGIPLVGLRDPAITGVQRIVKRLFDLAIAVPALILLSPLMAVIAVVVRLDSPGPAIFKQQRVGENGRLFWIYKFRTMTQDAESRLTEVVRVDDHGRVSYKRPDDPRITRVGRFLRRTSLDELPQLLNVIKGEMSLVGPRPELPWLVERYERWQYQRLMVPPGITGWWQVTGRGEREMHLHTEDDLYYIRNYSPLLDLRILIKTIGVVLRGKGAF